MITSCGKPLNGVPNFAYVYPDGRLAIMWRNYDGGGGGPFPWEAKCSHRTTGSFCGRGEVMRICEQCAIRQGIIW